VSPNNENSRFEDLRFGLANIEKSGIRNTRFARFRP